MKKGLLLFTAFLGLSVAASAQTATTFEMRYFTPDAAADGVTDFHGETEWFTTPQRVEMLGKYARYASRFWGDPGWIRRFLGIAMSWRRFPASSPSR